jgi:sugar phosphate isomerase/epimerase
MPKICLGQDGFVNIGQTKDTTNEEILSFAQREGFQGIELHNLFQPYDKGSASTIKKSYAARGLEIPGIQTGHITYYNNPIGDDPAERKRYVEAMDVALQFAEAIGAIHSTITPPVVVGEFSHDQYQKTLELYISVLKEVVAAAERRHVVMAIEPEPHMLLNGGKFRDPMTDISQVLDGIKSKNLCILFDICHANVLSHGDPSGFLRKLNGRVSWVHVADNDMKLTPTVGTATHIRFGEGNVDMERLMQTFKEEVPDLKWLQIDTWENPKPYDVASKNKAELTRILNKISWQ